MKHKNIGKRILTLLLCISLLLPNTSGYVYALEDTIPLTNAEVQDGTIILNEATDEIFADEVLTEELSEPAEEGETTPEEETTEETSEAPAEEMPVEGEDGVEDSEESEVTGPTEEMPVEGENNAEDSEESEDTESSEETPVEGEDNAEDSEESEVTEPTEETLMEGEEVVEESEAVVTDEAGEIESVDEVNIMSVALVATDALDEMCKDIFGLEDYAAFQANEGYREVYVANETPTEDSSASGSASHPFTSLDEAYEHIEVNGEGGIIHLSGDAGDVIKAYTKETTIWPNNEVPVIIVSDDYENAYLSMSSTSLDFNANVGFYNVKIKLDYESGASKATLFANGNTLVFGGKGMNNFAFENDAAGTRCYPTVFGASSSSTGTALAHSSVENTTLKIYAGTFSQIFGGGEFYSDVTGTANVVVDGYIAAENGKGAVAFSDTNLAYMEKGHHIYGGGASKYTSVNEREYAHTENTNVSLSYIETTKSVTAHGGIVNSTSVLNVDHCIIGGYVNARSEGAPASEVTMNISHSEIKGSVGAIGGTEGGVSKANKMEKTIDNLTINVNHAEVTGSILLREGALGGGSYNNFVNNATLVVKNSTAGEVRLTWADAINTSYGVLKKLELDTVQATFPDCSGGVGKIESIVLRNMGTEETPFVLSENKFSMIQTARNFGELVLENSHVNYISGSYTAEKLEMLDSSIKFDTGRVFKTEKFVASGNNTLEFTDEAYLEINGTVTESNTVSTQTIAEIPELSVGSRAGIIFNHEPKLSVAKELFTIDTDPTYVGILDNSLNAAFWIAYNGVIVEENYVYWDPTGGSDTAEGYSGECREEDLGYDNAYPVKTYAKALEKVKFGEKIKAIVLCGYFDVDYENAAGEFGLTSAEKGSSELTILTSKDSYFDYTGSSGFNFNNTVANTLALFNFNTAIQFEDINFINNGPGVVTLMCNGYKTIMQDGIENTGDFHLYGGSYNANVEKTDLSVLDGRWRRVAGTGKGAESSVGTVTTDPETEVVNLVVNNKTTEGTIYTYYVFDGDVNGSVNSTFTLNQNLTDNRIYMYVSGCNPGTVTGNFTTTITDDSKNNGDYKAQVYVYPRGITIQGKLSFEALAEQMRYSEIILPGGKIGGADINVAADLIARLLLFEANTLIDDKINWTVDGDVKVVAASRENDQLIQNKAQVNVTLKNGEYISINAGTANGSQTAEVSYQNSDSVHLTLFGEGNVTRIFEEVWGFSSITIDGNHIVDLKPEIVTNNLVVSNGANLLLRSNATVGKMSILSGAEVEARTGLTVEGDFTGDEVTPGTLVHNCANELGELQ